MDATIQCTIDVLNKKRISIITLNGKIRSENISYLNKGIQQVFENEIYNCIIDIKNLQYINSTGIAMILTIQKTVEQNNGKLLLVSPTEFVRELLHLTNLIDHFEIHDDLKSAKDYFANL